MKILLTICLVLLGGCLAAGWVWYKKTVRLTAMDKQTIHDLEQCITKLEEQCAQMHQSTEDLRAFRHDFRHHLAALSGYARSTDLAPLQDYLESLGIQRLDDSMNLCANAAADALARQYLDSARDNGVEVDAMLEISENPGISTPDLCVVLGNCLENAAEAARQAPSSHRLIRIRAKETPGWLSIVLENSCLPGSLQQSEEGYLSTKEAGRVGIGLRNVVSTVERYGGTAVFEKNDERFRTSLILFKKDDHQ